MYFCTSTCIPISRILHDARKGFLGPIVAAVMSISSKLAQWSGVRRSTRHESFDWHPQGLRDQLQLANRAPASQPIRPPRPRPSAQAAEAQPTTLPPATQAAAAETKPRRLAPGPSPTVPSAQVLRLSSVTDGNTSETKMRLHTYLCIRRSTGSCCLHDSASLQQNLSAVRYSSSFMPFKEVQQPLLPPLGPQFLQSTSGVVV